MDYGDVDDSALAFNTFLHGKNIITYYISLK